MIFSKLEVASVLCCTFWNVHTAPFSEGAFFTALSLGAVMEATVASHCRA